MQDSIHYKRIAEAIDFIRQNFKQQPKLEEVARAVHLSPSHFQRLFTQWAGTSPKKFLQYISIEHAKKILKDENFTLFDTAFETGLSSTSRLHDLFITIEGMTPAEFKNGAKNLRIAYSFANSPFGSIIIASTSKGICHLAFGADEPSALKDLKTKFPNAIFAEQGSDTQQNALHIFQSDWTKLNEIKLHLKGTDFQLKVWESLLKIPFGQLSTYGSIAEKLGKPNASRAVGTAIGNNPIAFLIPCHRVIKSTGKFDGYHWGTTRKTAIIGWEQSKNKFMNMLHIRKATTSDAKHIALLGRVTFTETFREYFRDDRDLFEYNEHTFNVPKIRESLKKKNNQYWIAFWHELPIGYAKLKIQSKTEFIEGDNAAQLQKIYVLKEFIGKRVGKLLIREVMKFFSQSSANHLWLSVLQSNERAIQFYNRNNFKHIGEYTFQIGKESFAYYALGYDKKHNCL